MLTILATVLGENLQTQEGICLLAAYTMKNRFLQRPNV